MAPYRLNMARGFVMPLEVRRKWLSWFFVYLLVCSVLIALVLYRLIESGSICHARRDALSRQEARLLARSSGHTSLEAYAGVLRGKVVSSLREAETLVDFERKKSRLASVFLGLADPLPPGVDLGAADYGLESRKLHFEVVMPSTLKVDDKLSPTHMVAAWEREPLLVGLLSQIEVENSERVKRDGAEMVCWRFSASVGEK